MTGPAGADAYIGLGSNFGDRSGQIERALVLLAAEPGVEVVVRVGEVSARARATATSSWERGPD